MFYVRFTCSVDSRNQWSHNLTNNTYKFTYSKYVLQTLTASSPTMLYNGDKFVCAVLRCGLATVNKFRLFVWSVLCGLGHPMICYRRLSTFIRTRKHKYCTLWLMLGLSWLKITSWHTSLVSTQHSVRLFFFSFHPHPVLFKAKQRIKGCERSATSSRRH